jgi:excisionase family DNA binding protein
VRRMSAATRVSSLVTISQAAERLGVSTRTIRRKIATGDLPGYRVGTLVRLRPDDVERLARPIPTVGNCAP